MARPAVPRPISGGLITNYYCTSQCRHCLYFCSPTWEKHYMDPETATEIIGHLNGLGCRSVHIGGGEPFLDSDGLEKVLQAFRAGGMGLEYVETNSSWYRNREQAETTLRRLKKAGLSTILVSVSPFHNEFIPLQKIEGVMSAAAQAGVAVFPWVDGFLSDLRAFDETATHSLEEYKKRYGRDYVETIPSRYWVTMRGRALKTYAPYMKKISLENLLARGGGGCSELFDTTHFHVDLFGNYVPGLCTGLSCYHRDVGTPLDKNQYPFLVILMTEGIGGLYQAAAETYGFEAAPAYVSKCELCYDIRRFLVAEKGVGSPDLQPVQYYMQE